MKFRLKKLALEKAASLRQVTLRSVEPMVPLPAPVYLLMTRNQKFISLKRPFDFFTSKELQTFAESSQLYYSDFFDRLEPFRQAAKKVKATLSWQSPSKDGLEPASYEISNEILKIISTLWAPLSPDQKDIIAIESYFAVVFANDVCERIPGDLLQQARDADIDRYELAMLRSGITVFFALHLGFADIQVLNQVRYRIFATTVGLTGVSALIPYSRELDELRRWVESVIPNSDIHMITSEQFKYSLNRVSQKLKSRLTRVRRELMDENRPLLSALGSEGVFEDNGSLEESEEVADG